MHTYSAVAVANSILDSAAKMGISDMTPMKLQKLLFFTQAWYVKNYDKVLFCDDILAWDYGPVVREVYREFSGFGSNPIRAYASNADGMIPVVHDTDIQAIDTINGVLKEYGKFDAFTLSAMTHEPNTPWSNARNYHSSIISEGMMLHGDV